MALVCLNTALKILKGASKKEANYVHNNVRKFNGFESLRLFLYNFEPLKRLQWFIELDDFKTYMNEIKITPIITTRGLYRS